MAIFDRVSVGFDFRSNSVWFVTIVHLVADAKMVAKGRVMARSWSSVIMLVRNIVVSNGQFVQGGVSSRRCEECEKRLIDISIDTGWDCG